MEVRFQTLFASTRRFNLLKSPPVDDDDIIIYKSLNSIGLSLPLLLCHRLNLYNTTYTTRHNS